MIKYSQKEIMNQGFKDYIVCTSNLVQSKMVDRDDCPENQP